MDEFVILGDIADELESVTAGTQLDGEEAHLVDSMLTEEAIYESYSKALNEAANGRSQAVQAYIAEVGADGSYEDFVESDYNTYGENSPAAWKRAYKIFLEKAGVEGGPSKGEEKDTPVAKKMSFEDIEASNDISDEFKLVASAIDRSAQITASSGNEVEERVNVKFKKMGNLVRNLCRGRATKRNVLLAGAPGVGKTHTAKAIIQKYYPTCTYGQPAVNEGEYSYSSGDIGTALSDIVVFLYRHRLDNLIVLDDCDAFISKKSGKPAVANLLKAALNSNPEKGSDGKWGNVVSVGPEIAKNANRKLGVMEEGKVIEIDLDVLNEEKCLDVYINGNLLASTGRLNESEIKRLKKDLPFLNSKKRFTEDEDDDFEEEGEILGGDKEFDGETGIGTEFVFTAPVLLISNLKEDEVDDAVVTRCEVYELDIKPEEFLIRSSQIIDNLEIGSFSTFDPEEIAFAKKQVMGGLKLAIDSMNKGIPLDPTSGRPVTIKKTLQFRVFSDLAGSYLAKMDDWIDDNDVEGLEDAQRILEEAKKTASGRLLQKMNTLNSFNEIVGFFIQGDWIKWDLIPYLEMRRI